MPMWDELPAGVRTLNAGRPRRRNEIDPLANPFLNSPEVASIQPFDPLHDFAPAPMEPPPPIELPPDEPGFLSSLGDVLDRPGNALRGLSVGRLDPLLGLLPFSETLGLYDPKKNRVSGQDVNEQWLGIEKSDSLLSGGGAAGLATELILDPLNFLPGFMGLKASTKGGVAAGKVAGHLDDAEKAVKAYQFGRKNYKTALQSSIEAAESAGKYITDDEIEALKQLHLKPKPVHPAMGDLLNTTGDVLSREELATRLAAHENELGTAARETLANKAARGLSDDQAFKVSAEAGERVNAGHEALFSVGGEFDPLALGRLGGKYNPVNWLPEVPGLTAPLHLPQKTIVEGAGAAQGIQNAWRGAKELPGIKQVGDLFNELPDVPGPVRDTLLELTKTSRNRAALGVEQAAEQAGKLNEELKAGRTVETEAELRKRLADLDSRIRLETGEIVDTNTGEQLDGPDPFKDLPPAPADLSPAGVDTPAVPPPPPAPRNFDYWNDSPDPLKLLKEDGPPSTMRNTIMPDFPSMEHPASVSGSRITPLQDVTGRPTLEQFNVPEPGKRVTFKRIDAIRKPDGAMDMSPRQTGFIDHIYAFEGRAVAQIGDWTVPLESLKRNAGDVKKDFQKALDTYEQDRVYSGLTKTEMKRLNQRAEDARLAFKSAQTDIADHPDKFGISTEIKDRRGKALEGLKFSETGIKEQAQALPKFIEAALEKGQVPDLKTIEFMSAESGRVGIGDKFPIAGDSFELKGFTPEGKAKLKDGIPIEVPMELIPIDKGGVIKQAETIDPLGLEFPPVEPSGKTGKFAKQNKAADVLAGVEQKLGVKPVEFERGGDAATLKRFDEAAPDPLKDAAPAPAIKESSITDPLADVERAEVAAENAKIEKWLKERKALDEMVTDAPPIKPLEVFDDVPEAKPSPFTPPPELTDRAKDVAEIDALQKRFGDVEARIKGTPAERVSGDDITLHRQLRERIDVRQARERIRTLLDTLGDKTESAAKSAAALLPEGSDAGFAKAVTDYLEHGGVDAPESVVKTATELRTKYDAMLKLEQARGLDSAALKSERIDYTTHVATDGGRRFFKNIAKNEAQQGALFKLLEDKRIRGGVAPSPEGLASAPRQKFDAQQNAPTGKRKRVPKGMDIEAEKRLMKLDAETREWIRTNDALGDFIEFSKEISNTHGSQIPRLAAYKHLGVSELNEAFATFGAKGPVFNVNPAAQQFAREARHVKVMAGADFLDGAAAQLGTEMAHREGKSIGNDIIDYGGGKYGVEALNEQRAAQKLPPIGFDSPEVAAAVADVNKKLTDPDQIHELLSWYDQITRTQKGFITRAFPAFHVRNHISNVIQSWLGGVPLSGEHRAQAWQALAGKDVKVKLGDGTSVDRAGLLKEFQESGAGRNGQFEELLKESVDPTVSDRTWKPWLPDNVFQENKVLKGAEKVSAAIAGGPAMLSAGGSVKALDGRMIEDGDRLAHYVYKRQQGFSPSAAAADVDKHLFDYSKESLSPFEQKYMNRAVFFYGYTRRAIPAMLEAAVTNTTKVKQITQLGQQPGGPEYTPKFAKGGLGVPLGKDAEGNSQLTYKLGTPVEGAAEVLGGGIHGVLNSLNPILKTPLELGTGQDFFLQKPIEEARKAPHWVEDLPDPLKNALGVVKIPTKSGKTKFEMDPLALFALGRSPLSRLSGTAGKATDDRKGTIETVANVLTGANTVSVDDENERGWAMKAEIKRRLKELERQGKVRSPEIFTADILGKGDDEVKALLKALKG